MHGVLWNYWGSASLLMCSASGKELQMLQVSDSPATSAVKMTARCALQSWCDGMQERSNLIGADPYFVHFAEVKHALPVYVI